MKVSLEDGDIIVRLNWNKNVKANLGKNLTWLREITGKGTGKYPYKIAYTESVPPYAEYIGSKKAASGKGMRLFRAEEGKVYEYQELYDINVMPEDLQDKDALQREYVMFHIKNGAAVEESLFDTQVDAYASDL